MFFVRTQSKHGFMVTQTFYISLSFDYAQDDNYL